MEKTESTKKGTLKVSEDVIAKIVKNAALEIEGVYKISSKGLKIKSFLKSPSDPGDIRISMDEGVCCINVAIDVLSGYNAVHVSEQIQEKVKAAVQSMTGVTVSKVNVTVSDVVFEPQQQV